MELEKWILGGLFITLGILVGVLWNVNVIYSYTLPEQTVAPFITAHTVKYSGQIPQYDSISPVACTSNSMGPLMQCGSRLYLTKSFTMDPGGVYTFMRGNQSIAHRLIACLDTECQELLFKGDANSMADEVVSLKDVTAKVVFIELP